MGKFRNILETVGNTPVVRINRLAPPGVNLFVKIEAFNPLGSVEGSLGARHHRGCREVGPIEARTNGYRGHKRQHRHRSRHGVRGQGLSARRDHGRAIQCRAAQAHALSRRQSRADAGGRRAFGMVVKATELAETHGWFLTRQFENEANADIHSRTTAPEIIADFKDERLDYWVTGYGTGGTLKGVSRVLAKERPDTKIIVCEPEDAQLLGSGIEQARNVDGSPAAAHPAFKPHPMQGWTPDFIPKLTEDAVGAGVIDRILPIPGADALRYSKELAQKEGIFVGISAGGTFAGALRICAEAPENATILCMLPDTGERYLSTPLFADVPADMTEEELEISRSTPSAQFAA